MVNVSLYLWHVVHFYVTVENLLIHYFWPCVEPQKPTGIAVIKIYVLEVYRIKLSLYFTNYLMSA